MGPGAGLPAVPPSSFSLYAGYLANNTPVRQIEKHI